MIAKKYGFLFNCFADRKEEIRMSQITIDLSLTFTIPDKDVTINSLIHGLKQSNNQINGTVIATIMSAIEERLIANMIQQSPGRYKRNGTQPTTRMLHSSLGPIHYRFAQLIDTLAEKKRYIVPLKDYLKIPSHQQYLDEALEPGIGLSVHVSFRRATAETERIRQTSMSHTTVHRRLQSLADDNCPFSNLKDKKYRFLIVDGTKVHLQGASGEDQGKVEMRWALASLGATPYRFEPVGFWIDTDWATIAKELKQRLNYDTLQVLFSDGGPGIAENLLTPTMKLQRCQWHGKRDFPYLLYADGAKKQQQEPFVNKLKSIAAMRLKKDDLEKLRPEDRATVETITSQTTRGFQELLDSLDPKKYPKARSYIQNLIEPVTTFLGWWLDTGEVIPFTTNNIESAFSQVCNRIKRVGRRWSEKGLLNWLKISFYKIFKPDQWNLLWFDHNQKIPLMHLVSINASYSWSGAITKL